MSFVIIILSSFFFKNCLLLLVLPCVPLPEFYLQAPVPIKNVGIQNWYGISMFHHIWFYISLKVRSPRRVSNTVTMTNVLIFHDLVLWLVLRVVIVVMLLMQSCIPEVSSHGYYIMFSMYWSTVFACCPYTLYWL